MVERVEGCLKSCKMMIESICSEDFGLKQVKRRW